MNRKFIAACWTLAVLFNIINIYFVIVFKQAFYTDHLAIAHLLPDFDFIGLDILFSIVFSLPGLAALFILIWIAEEFVYSVKTAWSLVVAGCSAITLLCYLILELVIRPGMNLNDYLPFIAASLAAVWISLIITRKQFFASATKRYEGHVL